MPLKRLWVGLPLAVLVALIAHLAGFGSTHLPGNDHASVLFGAVGLTLAAFLAAAFLRPLRSAARLSLATARPNGKAVLALAGVAALAFAAIELAEGRGVFSSTVLPLLALVPIAVIVGSLARRAESLAERAGARVAVYFRRSQDRFSHLVLGTRARAATHPTSVVVRRATRGRAPPRFV